MNKRNMIKLRAYLDDLKPERFGMQAWVFKRGEQAAIWSTATIEDARHTCGTAACLAGHAVAALGTKADAKIANTSISETERGRYVIFERASKLLGLSYDEAVRLFVPLRFGGLDALTKAGAIKALDHSIETGDVRWTREALDDRS